MILVAPKASSGEPSSELVRAPLWGELLDRTIEQILAARPLPRAPRASAIETMTRAAARADRRLLAALDGGLTATAELSAGSIADAAGLMLAVTAVWQHARGRPGNERAEVVEQLRLRLSGHEQAVLAGERTYSVLLKDAEQNSARLRHAIASLSHGATMPVADLTVLRSEATNLAALLVLAAANIAASGSAGEAPEERTAALDHILAAVTHELAASARHVERPVNDGGDVVAHHLAAGLRVRVSRATLDLLDAVEGGVDEACLLDARQAWLQLATNEYVAVTALDHQLETPAYDPRFGDLDSALVEGAANVICGARLLGRPGSFRHRRAWGHQAVALSYALEAYVAGLRGDRASLAQAQLIVLTRLVRALAAIAVLDLRCPGAQPANGKLRPLKVSGNGSRRADA